jgi:dephospho-CoA kinase
LLTIGLTGGIGSGKSTVAAMFVALGATLVDTDAISKSLTATGGAAMAALQREFGESIIAADGSLNRDRMRELAFSDPGARQRLEAILHPLIGEEAQRQAALANSAIVYDVPLLAESTHWRQRCNRIVVVDCEAATQLERVLRRPGWTQATAQAVIAQQARRETRRAIADAVIHNDGIVLTTLNDAVTQLWRAWTADASGYRPPQGL